jgi:hypothetical protein
MSEKKPIIQKPKEILKKDRGSWHNLLQPLKLAREIINEIKSLGKLSENTQDNSQKQISPKGLSISNAEINFESIHTDTKSANASNRITRLTRPNLIKTQEIIGLHIESIPYATEKDTGISDGFRITD